MQEKVYAVRNGRRTGIFHRWADCRGAVRGFKGAEYRGFDSEDGAREWLGDTVTTRIPEDEMEQRIKNVFSMCEKNAQYIAFADASCGDGSGGFASLVYDCATSEFTEQAGGEKTCVGKKMEIEAIISALKQVPAGASVEIYSGSEYAKSSFRQIPAWKGNGWRTSCGLLVPYKKLWEELDGLVSSHKVSFNWQCGRRSNLINERCSFLASEAAKKCA